MAGGGGAWKVAYADFVTAMMALFMVLWISAQDTKILVSTSRYFQNPFRSTMEEHSGVMPFNREMKSPKRASDGVDGSQEAPTKDKVLKLAILNAAAADLLRLFSIDQPNEQTPMDVHVTSDGLRLSVFNRAQKPVFKGTTSELTDWGRFIMQSLAWVIDRHRFTVAIDGHTQSGLVLTPEYSAWDLSADRANAARRALVFYAVDPGRIERVSGLADTRPVAGAAPDAEVNQRVSVSLRLETIQPETPGQAGIIPTPVPALSGTPVPALSAAPDPRPHSLPRPAANQ